jgi:hypothetical protein
MYNGYSLASVSSKCHFSDINERPSNAKRFHQSRTALQQQTAAGAISKTVGQHIPPAHSQQHTAAPHSRITSPLTLHTLLRSVTCFGPDTDLLQVTHMQRQFVRFDLRDCRNIKYVFFFPWHDSPSGPTAPSGTTAPSGRGPPHYRGFAITLGRHTTLR